MGPFEINNLRSKSGIILLSDQGFYTKKIDKFWLNTNPIISTISVEPGTYIMKWTIREKIDYIKYEECKIQIDSGVLVICDPIVIIKLDYWESVLDITSDFNYRGNDYTRAFIPTGKIIDVFISLEKENQE